MRDHLVKGCWLTGAVKFLSAHGTPEASERLLASLPKPLRSLLGELNPEEWYPRQHHVDLLAVLVGAQRDEASAYEKLIEYGQSVAMHKVEGSLRMMVPILTPKLLAKKLPDLWAADHQHDGKLETDIAGVDEGRLVIRLSALDGYGHIGIATLGWVKALLTSVARRQVVVTQTGWSLSQAAPSEIDCEARWS